MKNYKLQENEVVRYRNPVTMQTEKGVIPAEIVLTNLNFIFITEKKFLWFKPKKRRQAFAKELVKVYNGAPEVKQKGNTVTISFTTEDRVITFDDKKTARKFVINAWTFITGKSLFEHNLDKLKIALDVIDEKFDFIISDVLQEAFDVKNSIQDKFKKLFQNNG